jgi:RND superfamily putative drug exporter
MLHLGRLSVRHPVWALVLCGVVAAALVVAGMGVTRSLSPSVVVVAGTDSSRAQHLADAEFGPGVLVPILLEGPRGQLDREGPALARALAARPDTRVLSAWDGGESGAALRPSPTQAMVVASVARTERAMVDTYQARIESIVDRTVSAPVHASITGQPTLDRAFKQESVDATRRGALLAVAILFVLLVLLLRAPVVAAGLSALGAVTALAGLGTMTLLGHVMAVDAIALTLSTMTGLALGVGYGLMVYRRWREEVDADAAHHDAAHAALTAVATAGRAVLIGGTAVIVALVLATFIAPMENLASLGLGAVLCATLAIGAAVIVVPAALTLLGRRALWLSFPLPPALARAWDRLAGGGSRWVVRHAVGAGAAATALLLLLAIPALSLPTGPPTAELLPSDNGARQSFERVAAVMGPGWPTPFNIVIHAVDRPLTDKALLAAIERFQVDLARDPRVASVVGPGAFAAVSRDLGTLPKQLRESSKLLKGGKKDLGRLQRGLGQAGSGASQLREGLVSAAGGAGQLQGGAGAATSGAGQLRAGLDQARSGATQISGGLQQALDAARQLRDGAAQALSGSKQLTGGLGQAAGPVKQGLPIVQQMASDVSSGTDAVKGAAAGSQALAAQLDEAAAQLAALPDSPEKQAAQGAVQSARQAADATTASLSSAQSKLTGASAVAGAFASQVADLSTGLAQLYAGSAALTDGIAQLQDGNRRLADGIGQLSGGGSQLSQGVGALRDGAVRLEAGLQQLTSGAGQLAGGLSSGTGPTGRLVRGLGKLESGVTKFRSNLPSTKDLERLQRQSPGLFDSGYFVLAALSGATPKQRNQATFAVNLDRGGSTGQITVIARQGAAADATRALGVDLQRRVDAFAARTHTQAAVGGPAGQLGDFTTETTSRILAVVVALAVALGLLLMILLRAVLLPLVAIAFDLLVAAATFGAVDLLFAGDDPPLGGPGFIDPMSIIATFAALFGITVVYEVQLLQRTREAFVAGADAHHALRIGLRETAAAGTGAAIAMVAAIVPFAASGLVVARQVGVGVAVAIILDALVVRPVILPAAAELLGRHGWWPTRPHRVPAVPVQTPPVQVGGPVAGD